MMELTQKMKMIEGLLKTYNLNALLLRKVSSFAWITGGAASYINTAVSEGTATLLITPTGHHLITTNIEAPRLDQEEKLKAQGWEFHTTPWYAERDLVGQLTRRMKIGTDSPYPRAKDLSGDIARLRTCLTPTEVDRFRMLARLCGTAMDHAIRAVRPYQTEHEIAALLANETERRGVQPIVNLIATDDRIFSFRHPLPTSKRLERYAMLVLCGRRAGLVCSITRLVHFGPLSDEIRHKAEATARVDATFITATRPGRTVGEVFNEATEAYTKVGYPNEWQLHHQGGPAGYEPREFLATPGSPDLIAVGQTYAWNPSITGTKSEDTILVGDNSNEVLTDIEGWPEISVELNGQVVKRPAILEII